MSEVLEADIRGLFVDHGTETAVVLLGVLGDAHRVLPIAVGMGEAQAIADGISSERAPRPVTHDLLLRAIEAASGHVRRTDVVALVHGTFFAEVELVLSDRVVRLDARPSDCIALAVRADVPIGVERSLFDRAAVGVIDRPDARMGGEQVEEIMRRFRRFLEDAEPRHFRDAAVDDSDRPE